MISFILDIYGLLVRYRMTSMKKYQLVRDSAEASLCDSSFSGDIFVVDFIVPFMDI